MQKFGTKSGFKVWKTEWRFFSNSKVIKSHSQPIRIEHQLSLNWSRNSITYKEVEEEVGHHVWKLPSVHYIVISVYCLYTRRHLSHSSLAVKQLEVLNVITHLIIIIIKFNLIYFWNWGLGYFFSDLNLLLFYYANFELFCKAEVSKIVHWKLGQKSNKIP